MATHEHIMSVKDIMTQYKPRYPDSHQWEDTIECVSSTREEKMIILELWRQHIAAGGFREPILLGRDDETGDWFVNDGTHRLVTAFLLGVDTVKVQHESDSDSEDSECGWLETTISHRADSVSDDTDIFSVIRSLPLSDSDWVTTSFALHDEGSTNGVRCGYTTIYWDTDDTHLCRQISAQVERRIKEAFPRLEILSLSTGYAEDDENCD